MLGENGLIDSAGVRGTTLFFVDRRNLQHDLRPGDGPALSLEQILEGSQRGIDGPARQIEIGQSLPCQKSARERK